MQMCRPSRSLSRLMQLGEIPLLLQCHYLNGIYLLDLGQKVFASSSRIEGLRHVVVGM